MRSRDFDVLTSAQVAAGRTAARAVTAEAGFRPRQPRSMAEMLDTIEQVAEAATGERSFLHLGCGATNRARGQRQSE